MVVPKYKFTNEKNYDYYFPLGLAYIYSTIKKAKYSITCLNLNHMKGKTASLLNKELDRKKYDVVCTGGNALAYSAISLIFSVASQHASKPLTILGGPIITSEPMLIMDLIKPNYGVLGEGEVTILELLRAIKHKEDLSKVDGIVYFDETGKIIITKSRDQIKDISTIPWPEFEEFGLSEQLDNMFCNFDVQTNAQDYPRLYQILGSRGCPFNCTFCWHDQKYRTRPIPEIMKELGENVRKYKINIVHFLDECFSIDPQRISEFCKGMKKLSEDVGYTIYWLTSLMVTSADKKLLDIMKDAGCFSLTYGFESYSPIVLKSMRKPITPQQIDKAFNLTMDAKINVMANFILGDIAETPETANETIDYLKAQGKGQIGLCFVQPYPGSEIYKYCLKNNILKDRLSYIKNDMGSFNVVKITPNFTDEQFEALKKYEMYVIGHSYCFTKPIALKKMKSKHKKRYEVTIKCPFCKEVQTYKNCRIPNKWLFGFLLVCRNCRMRFFVLSAAQKIAYEHYNISRRVRTFYKKIRNAVKRNFI